MRVQPTVVIGRFLGGPAIPARCSRRRLSRSPAVGPLARAVAEVDDAAGLDELEHLLLGVRVVADAHVHPAPRRRGVIVGYLQ